MGTIGVVTAVVLILIGIAAWARPRDVPTPPDHWLDQLTDLCGCPRTRDTPAAADPARLATLQKRRPNFFRGL